jgi:hypothetical protein
LANEGIDGFSRIPPETSDPDNGEFNAYHAVGGVAGLMLQITPGGGRS